MKVLKLTSFVCAPGPISGSTLGQLFRPPQSSVPPLAALRFALRFLRGTRSANRLDVRVDVLSTFGERHDVIANRGKDDSPLRAAQTAQRFPFEQLLAKTLELPTPGAVGCRSVP